MIFAVVIAGLAIGASMLLSHRLGYFQGRDDLREQLEGHSRWLYHLDDQVPDPLEPAFDGILFEPGEYGEEPPD